MARLFVHVTPRSSRSEVVGWRGGELEVRVRSVPEAGKASAEACEVVARALGVPKSGVRVARGGSSRHKELIVDGVTLDDIEAAFGSSEV